MDSGNTNITPQLRRFHDSYMESFNFLQARKQRWVKQLILLNNLQRGDQNIASTLLLTLFNRVMSNSYDTKMQTKFLPSQGIKQEQLNTYNTLAQSDYIEMDKARLDYDWTWDALGFGRGYMETLRFNKKRKIMEPHVINPLVFGYDPYFDNHDDWRYYWKWITKSKVQIQKLIKKKIITGITKPEEIPSGVDEYLWQYKARLDLAKKAVEPSPNSQGGDIYQILEFFGYDEGGDKCVYWVDKSFSKVLYHEKLDLKKNEDDDEADRWPLSIKESFRQPHSSLNFGVFDILEDKHRAKSVLLNLAFIAAKDRANPIYMYNPDKVKDVTQLFSRQINQHIQVEDMEGAVAPLNTEDPMSPGLIQFISMLTTEANEPMGTGTVLQPIDKATSNTATEAAIDQQLNDMAQSLQSKIMQFGEKDFWSQWFHRYAKYGPELGEKMANIVGVKGVDTMMVDFKDFSTDFPPGVMVYSAKEAQYEELVKRRDFMQLYPQFAQTMDPNGFRNFNKHVFMPLMLEDPSLIDVMYPDTPDEMKAEEENVQLQQDMYVEVAPTDDHTNHIYTHSMVNPKTWAAWFHIASHEKALAEQKAMEMAMQQAQAMPEQAGESPQGTNTLGATLNVGAEKRSPIAAASPLKTEINPQTSQK